ncbi:hypothetical protein DYB31_013399 [Aphanomyces astaci]|uniref:phenylalanine 4-monooxygenase n=1 Tax=Aphanomyces astaci TaxID=112090 RepID=A0A397FZD2_APHAT|nr:hypothetical protein DYB31_013399 [Aphanomyces astaci]
MEDMWAKYACDEFKYILPLLESNCGYGRDNIPQAQDISDFLKECTGFTLRPVAGLLSARDFLNGLAFRVFFSTQDPDFADFSHEIGLASLGASDEEIERLATCYWFSVEFGVCMQNGEKKAYGAGLLSSFGELEYACSPTRPAGGEAAFPEYRPWNPVDAAKQKYPITTYQPVYYVADSLADAKARMREFTEDMKKPFYARYNPYQQTISVDRAVLMAAKDGSESLTSDETIHDDELVAVPKRKRIRKRAMDELAYLKGQVAEYTQQLHALQAKVPDLAAVSQWEGRSRRQAAERAAVEQENHKLKAALEGQLKIVESLVKIVTKRPKLAEEMYLDVGARHDALPADPAVRVARMHAMVDAEYPKWEGHFITKRLLDPPVATAPAIETNVQYVDERIGFDCIMRRALNVNVHDCASILWTMYFENMDITLVISKADSSDKCTVKYYAHGTLPCKSRQDVTPLELLTLNNDTDDDDNEDDIMSMPAAYHMEFAQFMMASYRDNLESLSIHIDHTLLAVMDPLDTKRTLYDSRPE